MHTLTEKCVGRERNYDFTCTHEILGSHIPQCRFEAKRTGDGKRGKAHPWWANLVDVVPLAVVGGPLRLHARQVGLHVAALIAGALEPAVGLLRLHMHLPHLLVEDRAFQLQDAPLTVYQGGRKSALNPHDSAWKGGGGMKGRGVVLGWEV